MGCYTIGLCGFFFLCPLASLCHPCGKGRARGRAGRAGKGVWLFGVLGVVKRVRIPVFERASVQNKRKPCLCLMKASLAPCLNRMIEMDNNDTLYKQTIREHILVGNTFKGSHHDGTILGDELVNAMKYLKSPIFD